MKKLLLILCLSSLSACTLEPVNPWDRNILAKEEMQPDSESIFDSYDEHIYFSKEASTGGASLGGGGCGCN